MTPAPPYEEGLRSSPAAMRNRAPILDILRQHITAGAHVLEIASGTGEHAAFFAQNQGWHWQCSDYDLAALETIAHWTKDASSVAQPPLHLDVMAETWAQGAPEQVDVIYCANMIHIAPPEAADGLIRGAQQILQHGGLLILYGPFRFGEHHSAPSNAAFDASLRARDPRWGLRDLGTVVESMRQHQLVHQTTHTMPANNLCVVFRRGNSAPTAIQP
ncbi:MAG: DUF938 domain-containing protein [Pseudomonadota bacterium]